VSKKDKNAPLEDSAPQDTPVEVTEEYRQEAGEAACQADAAQETYTVTREQMEKLNALAGQLEGANDKYLRLAAEYDNYRKRTAKEKETIYQDAKMDTIAKFLEVYDNLERAVSQAGDEENAHKKGMVMIFHQLEGVLEKMGVTIIDPAGETFDPARHNAVMHIDSDQLGESEISQVFQKGFLLGDKVIRFATVQVAN
jgi:molecular chaperone GrpE